MLKSLDPSIGIFAETFSQDAPVQKKTAPRLLSRAAAKRDPTTERLFEEETQRMVGVLHQRPEVDAENQGEHRQRNQQHEIIGGK